jgi:hypothetical protein
MFIQLTNQKGHSILVNLNYVDEIAIHESGEGTVLWSTKPGIKHWYVKERYLNVVEQLQRTGFIR